MQHCKKFGVEVFIVSEYWFKVTPRTVCPQSNCLTKVVSKVKHIVKLSFIDIILLIFSTKRLSLEACFIESEPHKMWVRKSLFKNDPKKSMKILVAIFLHLKCLHHYVFYNTHIRRFKGFMCNNNLCFVYNKRKEFLLPPFFWNLYIRSLDVTSDRERGMSVNYF